MTTIATDGKTMAGDGQAQTDMTIVDSNRRKVFRLTNGSLVGCAGNSVDAISFRRWLDDDGNKPHIKEEFAALVLNKNGDVEYYDRLLVPLELSLPTAIGSGADFALAAMDAGASPAQAVEIAARRDPYTGGTITVEAI
jgi:ATP-dependent protease HslVU (ClpYQ) peptidase subunit